MRRSSRICGGPGVLARPVERSLYLPSGKFNIVDPDGYHIEVMHWGKPEQEAWEKRISQNALVARRQSPVSTAVISATRVETFALVTSTTEATMIALPIRM
jgi:hypothetical protein